MDGIIPKDRNEEKLLEHSEIFTSEELRNIFVTRKNLENKIERRDKSAFISYIEHELKIWNRIQSSKRKKHKELQKLITLKVTKLHTLAVSYYKQDIKLWLSYIKFCIQAEINVSGVFSQMLLVHTDTHLWQLAAKWEVDECENIDRALNYLYRGLHHNPKDCSLYTDIFSLELESIKKKQEKTENKATKIFETSQKELGENSDFYIDLLKTASDYDFTAALQTKISQYLIKTFSKTEKVWHFFAQRELKGYHYAPDMTYRLISPLNNKECIRNCIEKYQQAVEMVSSEVMWKYYLNTVLDLYEDKIKSDQFTKEAFMSACNDAHKANFMTEEHYLVWFECLKDNPTLIKVLESATLAKPKYLQVWISRLRYHMSKKENDIVESIFNEAINILKDESIQIWRMKIQYYQLHKADKIQSVFWEGIKFSQTVATHLKPQFLGWLALCKSPDIEQYKQLAALEPFSMEIHTRMAELEAMSAAPDQKTFDLIVKLAIEQFGENVWLDYVNREVNYGPPWRQDVYKKYLLRPKENK